MTRYNNGAQEWQATAENLPPADTPVLAQYTANSGFDHPLCMVVERVDCSHNPPDQWWQRGPDGADTEVSAPNFWAHITYPIRQ